MTSIVHYCSMLFSLCMLYVYTYFSLFVMSLGLLCFFFFFFFFKQKTAYEMRISDWSSDVCSSDLEYPHTDILERAIELYRIAIDHVAGRISPVTEMRSEERRVGKECVSTCRSRWSPYH